MFAPAPETHAGCGKFALRGLAQSLAEEFQPAGVHIAHVIINGVIGDRRYACQNSSITSVHYSYLVHPWSGL